ncbi:winged helix-turn-helix domain-containing protein [Actinacidiphila oryziradicis]|uniref:Winged helix-turn-helix transcriptional regulator n=1 Tax=Actinacidiphila oryziradicis TaxID=2571141 RepID=A0A4U0SNZ6_9ACTN|nr:winged helix-turn-helix domain-containing protein [Actinacidiphila oryziradicis]TKA10948.1 winged helix-turn-helix transcriptional regulator [Actinacidiphila oryziradicis]
MRIADDLQRQIESGKIPPGAKLPGELELSEAYRVSAGTVRRAVRELRERGLVATLAAKGTYVVDQAAE